MIILERKKIMIVLGIITMFIFTYIITSYNVNNSSTDQVKTMQTVALPVDSKIIVIDARARNSR